MTTENTTAGAQSTGGTQTTSTTTATTAAQGTTGQQQAPAVSFPSTDAFNARIAEARQAERNALLKELGVESPDAAKGAIAKARELEQASLTEQQKLSKSLEELKPQAARASALEASIKEALAAEEGALPEDKKGLLELAPTDPGARLAWFTKARAKGLFGTAATTEQKAEQKPAANTKPNGTNPAPATPGGAKDPREMTAEEYAAYRRQAVAEITGR